jgi:hypothetical protein
VGEVLITLSSSPLEHLGLDVELVGRYEVEGSDCPPFLIQTIHVVGPGTLTIDTTYKFVFNKPPFKTESLQGTRFSIKYGVKMTLLKSFTTNLVVEQPFVVQLVSPRPGILTKMKTEIGFEDLLQVELSLDRLKYCTSDVVSGCVYFIQVRIPLKSLYISLVRIERIRGSSYFYDLGRQEIMDGPAQRGDEVPLRLHLGPLPLTSTMLKIDDEFAVKYAVNLEFEDEEGNIFERSQEIGIWRRSLGGSASNPFVS